MLQRESDRVQAQARKVSKRIEYLTTWLPKWQAELDALTAGDPDAIAALLTRA